MLGLIFQLIEVCESYERVFEGFVEGLSPFDANIVRLGDLKYLLVLNGHSAPSAGGCMETFDDAIYALIWTGKLILPLSDKRRLSRPDASPVPTSMSSMRRKCLICFPFVRRDLMYLSDIVIAALS
jgi:hypothetical protein